jgi:hemerythrin
MAEHHCPASEKNKAAHRQFLENFRSVAAQFKAQGATTSVLLDLRKLVAEWLTGHICAIDTKLRPCAAACNARTHGKRNLAA